MPQAGRRSRSHATSRGQSRSSPVRTSRAPISIEEKAIMRPMSFEHPAKVTEMLQRLTAFMHEHVYPNEETCPGRCGTGDRWPPPAIVEERKPKARAAGLWNLF